MKIRAKLADMIGKVVASPEVSARLSALQTHPLGTTPAEMGEILRQTNDQWAGIIGRANIRLD